MSYSSWVPLHLHSIYSIRDAIAKIPDIMTKAKSLHMPAIALTDHGTMAGSIEFYKEAFKHNIKPIIGSELYLANRSRFSKVDKIDKYYHITALAMNNKGYQNLSKLVGESNHPDSFYKRPRIDRELLKQYNEGIIFLSGCVAGHLPQHIRYLYTNDEDPKMYREAERKLINGEIVEEEVSFITEDIHDIIEWYKEVLGDRFYIEVQYHKLGEFEDIINNNLIQLAREHNIKIVATGDSHYVNREDKILHDIILSNNFKRIGKENLAGYPGTNYHIMSRNEMVHAFQSKYPDIEEYLDNTYEIAERCNVTFEFNNYRIPSLVDPEKEDDILIEMVEKGLMKRYGTITEEIRQRAQLELNTIIRMNVSSYFLLISEYIHWARKNNVPIGIGRGSSSGSIVSYALEITNVDPLKYKLLFSRFLNKGRSSYPIFDFIK